MTDHHVSFYGWDDGLYASCNCGWQDHLGNQPVTVERMQIVKDEHIEATKRRERR